LRKKPRIKNHLSGGIFNIVGTNDEKTRIIIGAVMNENSPRAIWCIKGDSGFNRIYIALGNPQPVVRCINKKGDTIWEAPTKGQAALIAISPAYHKLYLYLVSRRGANSLVCMSTEGKLLWSNNLDVNLSSLTVNKYADICVVGTAESRVIGYDGKGKTIFSQRLEAWTNPIHVFFHKRIIISASQRGYIYILDTSGNKITKKGKIDLKGKIDQLVIKNGFTGFVDFCSLKNDTLHIFDPEEDSYLDYRFRNGIKQFTYSGKGLKIALKNSHLVSMNEGGSLDWAVGIKERVLTMDSDDWGEYLLVGTERFNLFMFDKNGKLLWVQNTAGKDPTPEAMEKGFARIGEEDVLREDDEKECKANMILIDTLEKIFIPSVDSGPPEEIEAEKDSWIDDVPKLKKIGVYKDFKPFAVEKKMVVKSNLTAKKGLPILLVQVENTTETAIKDIRIYTELDKDIFYIKRSPLEHDALGTNTAKTFAVRFIPTSIEGKAMGSCRMEYIAGGERKEIPLKKFTLNNVWPDMTPLDIGETPWKDFIASKANLRSERFTSLSPNYLIPIVGEISEKRGFKLHNTLKEENLFILQFTSKTSSYQYGLEVEISPSPQEPDIFIVKILLFSQNKVNLSLLDYMFMDEMDLRIKTEEDERVPVQEEGIHAPGSEGRYKYAKLADMMTVPAPAWSNKENISIPVSTPEGRESPEYHPAGLPMDFRIYNRYSDYYSDHFLPYPKKKQEKEKLIIEPGKGMIYLFEEASPNRAFDLFKNMIDRDFNGLYITREYPKKVMNKYDLEGVKYLWLTNVPEKNALRPTDTEKLRFAFRKHLTGTSEENAKDKVILLDGVEYLVTHNTFSSILKLLQAIGDIISMTKGTLLIPISPATFSEQERKLLEREADEIIY